MVAPFELNDLVPACGTSSEPDCAHSGLCAGAGHANLLKTWNETTESLGEFDLDFSWTTKAETVLSCADHRITNLRVVMTHDHRAPRQHVVDVSLPVDVKDVSAVSTLHKSWCTPHGFKGSDRRINTAWNMRLCAFEQCF